jgi:hypothetical protein
MKRMKSELHGFCHAHDKNEEDYLRKLGWIEEGEQFPWQEEVVTAVAEIAVTEEAPRRGRKKKEGRL